jgi:hypothetical protein
VYSIKNKTRVLIFAFDADHGAYTLKKQFTNFVISSSINYARSSPCHTPNGVMSFLDSSRALFFCATIALSHQGIAVMRE